MLVARKLELGSNAVVSEVRASEDGLDVTLANLFPVVGTGQDVAQKCKWSGHQSAERDAKVDDAWHA
jgi:hypothetical protein